ncbi:hypothetical protein ABPG77_000362 [Micractinium sp. CCAP 211/92]
MARRLLMSASSRTVVALLAVLPARASTCVYCNSAGTSRLSCIVDEEPFDCLSTDGQYHTLKDCSAYSSSSYVAINCPDGVAVCPQFITLGGVRYVLHVLKPAGTCPTSGASECGAPALSTSGPSGTGSEANCQ